jgi:hypothetical protein
MSKSKSRKKRPPKRVLALPDLAQAKTAVLNSLASASGQRTYDHAIREFRRLVLFGASPRVQSHRCASLPDSPRTTRICTGHDQPSAGRRPAHRVRGGRCRPPVWWRLKCPRAKHCGIVEGRKLREKDARGLAHYVLRCRRQRGTVPQSNEMIRPEILRGFGTS